MTVASIADPTGLNAQIADYYRLTSRAGCLSVDLVLQLSTLATALENLRITHDDSLEIIQDVQRLLDR